MIVDMVDLKLSAGRALWGHVFPKLRAVCVNASEQVVFMHLYHDEEISEDDKELCECFRDEVIADFGHLTTKTGEDIEFEIPLIRIDYPQEMPLNGQWVYYRYESKKAPYFTMISTLGEYDTFNNVNLRLVIYRALLGNVFPNLRGVTAKTTDTHCIVHFYYDGELSQDDKELCQHVINEIIADYSLVQKKEERKMEFEIPLVRIDYPQKMPLIGGWVYYRMK